MRKLTISKIELAQNCLYPFRDDVEVPEQDMNPFAVVGNEVHAAIECVLGGKHVTPELSETAESFFDHWAHYYTIEDFGLCLTEAAFAFNVVTQEIRFLGCHIGREYKKLGAGDDDVCGSVDLISVKDGVLYIYDWKTGQQYHLTRFENPQVRLYGAIVAKFLGFASFKGVTVVINDQGVREYCDDVLAIDDILTYTVDISERIEMGDPQPTPGSHCKTKYCALAATCPALDKAAVEIMRPIPVPLATKADVAATVSKLLALEAQAAAIWKMVDARVEEMGEDIELPNGKTYGLKATTREYIKVTDEARLYLTEVLGADAVDEAVKVSVTKESIKAGVKKCAAKGKAASMERDVIGKLRDLGVVGEKTTLGYGVK